MADLGAGVELIVGCVRDRTFGPVLMVGLGGVHAEVLADTACALAPVGVDQARQLVLSLRGAALLTGVRGSKPVDLDALAAAVSARLTRRGRAPRARPSWRSTRCSPARRERSRSTRASYSAQPSTSRR